MNEHTHTSIHTNQLGFGLPQLLMKEAGRVKTRLIEDLLTELNAAPDRVLFPKGNVR